MDAPRSRKNGSISPAGGGSNAAHGAEPSRARRLWQGKERAMAEPKDPACDERPDESSDELMEDGQEEVFSRTAVEHGLIRDPPAIGPEHYDEEADGAGRS